MYNGSRPSLEGNFLAFAEKRQCELKDWSFVDSLFLPFYELGGISPKMISDSSSLDRTSTCIYNPITQTLTPTRCKEGLEAVILPVLKELKINQTLTFTFNDLDEPRIVFPSKKYLRTQHENSPSTIYSHSPDSLLKACANVPIVKQSAKFHGFLTSPGSMDLVLNNPLPIFSSSSINDCTMDIVIPSHYTLEDMDPARQPPVEYRIGKDWKNKTSKVYWRGSNTGANYGWNQYDLATGSQRLHLVGKFGQTPSKPVINSNKFAENIRKIQSITEKRRKEKYDLGLVAFIQCVEPVCSELKEAYPLADRHPSTRVMDYKYLVDVDGNSFSRRFVYLLRWSSSLVFKITLFQDWVNAFMKPWVHYVPARVDLSDLDAKVTWAEENDDRAREIAYRGTEQAEKRLRLEDRECYWARVMMHFDHLVRMGK